MKASITYAALSLFLILCACAVPALAFHGPYTDAQRLGAVGVPAGLAVVLWALRDARATVARWRVEGELRRAEEERQERRERRVRLTQVETEERELVRVHVMPSQNSKDMQDRIRKRINALAMEAATLKAQIAADEAREKMEAQP